MSDPETLAVYNTRAHDYANLTHLAAPSGALQRFIKALPKQGHVLDLGCGPGSASLHMRQAGLTPDPMDASEEMVRIARDTHGLPARLATFDDISGTAVFDGIWANFSLLHATRADMARHLAALSKALKPMGLFHIGMKTGDGAKRDPIGRHYTFYTEAELVALLAQAGITTTWQKTGAEPGLDGVTAPFILLQGHKHD